MRGTLLGEREPHHVAARAAASGLGISSRRIDVSLCCCSPLLPCHETPAPGSTGAGLWCLVCPGPPVRFSSSRSAELRLPPAFPNEAPSPCKALTDGACTHCSLGRGGGQPSSAPWTALPWPHTGLQPKSRVLPCCERRSAANPQPAQQQDGLV